MPIFTQEELANIAGSFGIPSEEREPERGEEGVFTEEELGRAKDVLARLTPPTPPSYRQQEAGWMKQLQETLPPDPGTVWYRQHEPALTKLGYTEEQIRDYWRTNKPTEQEANRLLARELEFAPQERLAEKQKYWAAGAFLPSEAPIRAAIRKQEAQQILKIDLRGEPGSDVEDTRQMEGHILKLVGMAESKAEQEDLKGASDFAQAAERQWQHIRQIGKLYGSPPSTDVQQEIATRLDRMEQKINPGAHTFWAKMFGEIPGQVVNYVASTAAQIGLALVGLPIAGEAFGAVAPIAKGVAKFAGVLGGLEAGAGVGEKLGLKAVGAGLPYIMPAGMTGLAATHALLGNENLFEHLRAAFAPTLVEAGMEEPRTAAEVPKKLFGTDDILRKAGITPSYISRLGLDLVIMGLASGTAARVTPMGWRPVNPETGQPEVYRTDTMFRKMEEFGRTAGKDAQNALGRCLIPGWEGMNERQRAFALQAGQVNLFGEGAPEIPGMEAKAPELKVPKAKVPEPELMPAAEKTPEVQEAFEKWLDATKKRGAWAKAQVIRDPAERGAEMAKITAEWRQARVAGTLRKRELVTGKPATAGEFGTQAIPEMKRLPPAEVPKEVEKPVPATEVVQDTIVGLRRSIADGEMRLRSKVNAIGEKLSLRELKATRDTVKRDKARLAALAPAKAPEVPLRAPEPVKPIVTPEAKPKEAWEQVWREYVASPEATQRAAQYKMPGTGLVKNAEAHGRAISDALAEGKPVPAEVLADYPGLAAKYRKKPPEAEQAMGQPSFVVDEEGRIARVVGWNVGKPTVIYPGKTGGIRPGTVLQGGARPYEYILDKWQPASASDFSRQVRHTGGEKMLDLRRWRDEFVKKPAEIPVSAPKLAEVVPMVAKPEAVPPKPEVPVTPVSPLRQRSAKRRIEKADTIITAIGTAKTGGGIRKSSGTEDAYGRIVARNKGLGGGKSAADGLAQEIYNARPEMLPGGPTSESLADAVEKFYQQPVAERGITGEESARRAEAKRAGEIARAMKESDFKTAGELNVGDEGKIAGEVYRVVKKEGTDITLEDDMTREETQGYVEFDKGTYEKSPEIKKFEYRNRARKLSPLELTKEYNRPLLKEARDVVGTVEYDAAGPELRAKYDERVAQGKAMKEVAEERGIQLEKKAVKPQAGEVVPEAVREREVPPEGKSRGREMLEEAEAEEPARRRQEELEKEEMARPIGKGEISLSDLGRRPEDVKLPTAEEFRAQVAAARRRGGKAGFSYNPLVSVADYGKTMGQHVTMWSEIKKGRSVKEAAKTYAAEQKRLETELNQRFEGLPQDEILLIGKIKDGIEPESRLSELTWKGRAAYAWMKRYFDGVNKQLRDLGYSKEDIGEFQQYYHHVWKDKMDYSPELDKAFEDYARQKEKQEGAAVAGVSVRVSVAAEPPGPPVSGRQLKMGEFLKPEVGVPGVPGRGLRPAIQPEPPGPPVTGKQITFPDFLKTKKEEPTLEPPVEVVLRKPPEWIQTMAQQWEYFPERMRKGMSKSRQRQFKAAYDLVQEWKAKAAAAKPVGEIMTEVPSIPVVELRQEIPAVIPSKPPVPLNLIEVPPEHLTDLPNIPVSPTPPEVYGIDPMKAKPTKELLKMAYFDSQNVVLGHSGVVEVHEYMKAAHTHGRKLAGQLEDTVRPLFDHLKEKGENDERLGMAFSNLSKADTILKTPGDKALFNKWGRFSVAMEKAGWGRPTRESFVHKNEFTGKMEPSFRRAWENHLSQVLRERYLVAPAKVVAEATKGWTETPYLAKYTNQWLARVLGVHEDPIAKGFDNVGFWFYNRVLDLTGKPRLSQGLLKVSRATYASILGLTAKIPLLNFLEMPTTIIDNPGGFAKAMRMFIENPKEWIRLVKQEKIGDSGYFELACERFGGLRGKTGIFRGIERGCHYFTTKTENFKQQWAFMTGYAEAKGKGLSEIECLRAGHRQKTMTGFDFGVLDTPFLQQSFVGRIMFPFTTWSVKQIEWVASRFAQGLKALQKGDIRPLSKVLTYAVSQAALLTLANQVLGLDMSNVFGVGILPAFMLAPIPSLAEHTKRAIQGKTKRGEQPLWRHAVTTLAPGGRRIMKVVDFAQLEKAKDGQWFLRDAEGRIGWKGTLWQWLVYTVGDVRPMQWTQEHEKISKLAEHREDRLESRNDLFATLHAIQTERNAEKRAKLLAEYKTGIAKHKNEFGESLQYADYERWRQSRELGRYERQMKGFKSEERFMKVAEK